MGYRKRGANQAAEKRPNAVILSIYSLSAAEVFLCEVFLQFSCFWLPLP